MVAATHHLHKRKRIYKKKEPYPHPEPWKRFLDKLVYVVGIVGPLSAIPQILKIWIEKVATGVSSITWAFYLMGSIIMLFYAITHKEKPLIIMYSSWIIINTIIFIGILIYS